LTLEIQILVNSIHLASSFLWWSMTFVVLAIIRPLNKKGNLSVILPRFRKIVLCVSTVSIVSGLILFGINSNYRYYELFYTFGGNMVFISGILSLFVYYNVLSGGKNRSITVISKKIKGFNDRIPIMLFSMLTMSLILMILISRVFLR
jgi:nitric oxide reductase large subunit